MSALERSDGTAAEETLERFDPVGNERLTAIVGIVLLVLTVVEFATIPLGVHRFMSLHVFVGFVLIPPIVLKLASTGWRFARYYTGTSAYVVRGPPLLPMRLLAPFLVAATVVLFASGVAMGLLHGQALSVARRLHGPASVLWLALVGVHVLVYLQRALTSSAEDAAALLLAARGARGRAYLLATAIVSGVVIGIATVPAQHHWVNLRRDHHHDRNATASTPLAQAATKQLPSTQRPRQQSEAAHATRKTRGVQRLGHAAAASYSLMIPPRMSRRRTAVGVRFPQGGLDGSGAL